MSVDLTAGVVRILHPNGNTAGTGFVVSDDGGVLTCAHVVRSAQGQPNGKVRLVFYRSGIETTAVVEQCLAPDKGDVALLRTEGVIPASLPLPLGTSEGTSGHPFRAFGFPEQDPVKGMFGYGAIGDSKPEVDGFEIVQLTSSTEVTRGFSGGPVLDIRNRRVVGMVSDLTVIDDAGRGGQTAFMIPTETLRAACSKLRVSQVCPYLGLDAFSEEDVDFYFGRDRDTDHLLARLRSSPGFLAVLGPSGSGKSSVVQAGLLPKLREGALPGSEHWGIVLVRPANDPFGLLATAGISDAENDLGRAVDMWLAKGKGKTRLVLVMDQFEELFVSCAQPLRGQFAEELIRLLRSSLPITVILVMRDDFYSRVSEEVPDLLSWIEAGISNIRTVLEKDDLTAMIQGPAKTVGLDVEPLLIKLIEEHILAMDSGASIAGKAGRSSVLPLLEFALTLVWTQRRDGVLTASSYESVGGLAGALTQWADDAYRRFDKESQTLVERVFKNLIHVGNETENTPDTRLRRSVQSLCSEGDATEKIRRVIWRLADSRLLVTYRDDQTKQESVEIIHDALIREWGRLRQWVADDKRFLLWRQFIEDRAQAWIETKATGEAGWDVGRLLRGRDLDEAEAQLTRRQSEVNGDSHDYIRASVALRDREIAAVEAERTQRERDRRRNRTIASASGSILCILTIIVSGLTWRNAEQARSQAVLRLADLTSTAMQSLRVGDSSAAMQELADSLAAISKHPSLQFYNRVRLRLQDQVLPELVGIFELQSPPEAVSFSPDGRKLLITSGDGTVQIWNTQVSTPVQLSGTIVGDVEHESVAARFSEDGEEVIALTKLQQVTIFRLGANSPRLRIDLPYIPKDAQFARGGLWLITEEGLLGTRVDLWSAENGELIHRFDIGQASDAHRSAKSGNFIEGSTCSRDNRMLAIATADGSVRVYELARFTLLRTLEAGEQLFSVSFDPAGTRLLASGTSGVHVWNLGNWTELPKYGGQVELVNTAKWSPDGNAILGLSQGDNPKLWDLSKSGRGDHTSITLSILGSPGLKTGFPTDGAFTPDGATVVTWQADTVITWDRNTGARIATLRSAQGGPMRGHITDVDVSKDGGMLAAASADGSVRLWQLPRLPSSRAHWSEPWLYHSCGEPYEGENLKVVTLDGIAVWIPPRDKPSEEVLRQVLSRRFVSCWQAVSQDGRYAVRYEFGTVAPKGLTVYDTTRGAIVHQLPSTHELWAAAFSPRGDLLVTKQIGADMSVYDVQSGDLLKSLPDKDDNGGAPVFSLDEQKLMTHQGSRATVWSTRTWSQVNSVNADGQVLRVASFDPSGKLVITGDGDGIAKLWSISEPGDAQLLATLPPDNRDVISATFDPSGRFFCTYSRDGTTHLWALEPEVQSDREIATIRDPGVPTFSQEGGSLMTVSMEKASSEVEVVGKLWNLNPMSGSTEQIKLWVEVRTGTAEDTSQAGAVRVLKPAEWRAKKEVLNRSGFQTTK